MITLKFYNQPDPQVANIIRFLEISEIEDIKLCIFEPVQYRKFGDDWESVEELDYTGVLIIANGLAEPVGFDLNNRNWKAEAAYLLLKRKA